MEEKIYQNDAAPGKHSEDILRDVAERHRADDALRQYNQRLRIFQEIGRAILAARSPEQIAQAAMRHIHELVPCLRASVAVFDFMANKARLIATHTKTKTHLDAGAELSLETFGDIGQLWLGKVNVVEDTEKISPIGGVRAEGLRAYINVPLRAQGELIGVLNLGAERPGKFSGEQIEIMQEVAGSLAVAIRQARLYEQIEQHANCLATRRALSPARPRKRKAASSWRTTAPFFWMRLASWRSKRKSSCCAFCKSANLSASAALKRCA